MLRGTRYSGFDLTSRDSNRGLFIAQRDDGIDPSRLERGDETRQQSDRQHPGGDDDVGRRIEGGDFEQNTLERPAQEPCDETAAKYSEQDQRRAPLQDGAEDRARLGAQGLLRTPISWVRRPTVNDITP